jgi:hypothetical protein
MTCKFGERRILVRVTHQRKSKVGLQYQREREREREKERESERESSKSRRYACNVINHARVVTRGKGVRALTIWERRETAKERDADKYSRDRWW